MDVSARTSRHHYHSTLKGNASSSSENAPATPEKGEKGAVRQQSLSTMPTMASQSSSGAFGKFFRSMRRSFSRGFSFGYHMDEDEEDELDDIPVAAQTKQQGQREEAEGETQEEDGNDDEEDLESPVFDGRRNADFKAPPNLCVAWQAVSKYTAETDPWSPSERKSLELSERAHAASSEEWSRQEYLKEQVQENMELMVLNKQIKRTSAKESEELYREGLTEQLELRRLALWETKKNQKYNSRHCKTTEKAYRLEALRDIVAAEAATTAGRWIDRRAVKVLEAAGRIEQCQRVCGRLAARKAAMQLMNGDLSNYTFETIDCVAEFRAVLGDKRLRYQGKVVESVDEVRRQAPVIQTEQQEYSRRLQMKSNQIAAQIVTDLGIGLTHMPQVPLHNRPQATETVRFAVTSMTSMLNKIQPIMPSMAEALDAPWRATEIKAIVDADLAAQAYRLENVRNMAAAEAATLANLWASQRHAADAQAEALRAHRRIQELAETVTAVSRWTAARVVRYAEAAGRLEQSKALSARFCAKRAEARKEGFVDAIERLEAAQETKFARIRAQAAADEAKSMYITEWRREVAAAQAATIGARRISKRISLSLMDTAILEHRRNRLSAEAASRGARWTARRIVKHLVEVERRERCGGATLDARVEVSPEKAAKMCMIERQRDVLAAEAAMLGAKWAAKKIVRLNVQAALLEHQRDLVAAESATAGAKRMDKKAAEALEGTARIELAKYVSGRFAAQNAAATAEGRRARMRRREELSTPAQKATRSAEAMYILEHRRDLIAAEAATMAAKMADSKAVKQLEDLALLEHRRGLIVAQAASCGARLTARRSARLMSDTGRQERLHDTREEVAADSAAEICLIEHLRDKLAAEAATAAEKWATKVNAKRLAAHALLEHQRNVVAADASTAGARLADSKAAKLSEEIGRIEQAKYVSGRFAAEKATATAEGRRVRMRRREELSTPAQKATRSAEAMYLLEHQRDLVAAEAATVAAKKASNKAVKVLRDLAVLEHRKSLVAAQAASCGARWTAQRAVRLSADLARLEQCKSCKVQVSADRAAEMRVLEHRKEVLAAEAATLAARWASKKAVNFLIQSSLLEHQRSLVAAEAATAGARRMDKTAAGLSEEIARNEQVRLA